MSRNVMVTLLLLAVVLAPVVTCASSGDVPLHGILTPVFGGGSPAHGVYVDVPPHAIIIVAPSHGVWIAPVVTPSHGVWVGPPTVPGNGTQDNSGGGGGLAPVTDMALLYPDFSPQGTIEAARRGDGWPWQVPAPLQTPEMRALGVPSYWQALAAYQMLFTRLAQAGPPSVWADREAQCAEIRGLFDCYVNTPGKFTPAQLLSLGQAGLKLLEAPLAAGAPQTLPPDAAGFPAGLPLAFRNAAERDALVGALQVSAQPGTPDPALWGIWALYLGAVQTPESATALGTIVGGHILVSNSPGPWEAVAKLPGGPRYLWGLELSCSGDGAARNAIPADDPAVQTALAQVEQAGDKVGYTLVSAECVGTEADFLFASRMDPGAGWYVRSLWTPGGVLPADLSTSGDQGPAAVARRFAALLSQMGQGPAGLRVPRPRLEYLAQTLDAQSQGHYYKLEGSRWRPAQMVALAAQ